MKFKNFLFTILGVFAVIASSMAMAQGIDFACEFMTSDVGLALSSGASLMTAPLWLKTGSFVEMDEKELVEFLKDADVQAVAGYYKALNDHKDAELAKLIEGKADAKAIDTLRDEMKDSQTKQMNVLNERLIEMGLAIKKFIKRDDVAGKSETSLEAGLKANLETLKSIKANNSKDTISFKVVGDMTIAGNVSGGNVPVEQRLDGLDVIASRKIKLLDLVSRGVATSNVISWVSQAVKDGAAGGTTEGATKNQIDFDLVVVNENIKKRTAFIKASTEMLDDIPFMRSEINNELMRELLKDIENQVYQGDGTGNNLNGIRTVATAFAAGDFALAVDNANKVDVLVVAMNQIEIADQDMATAIFMHPTDVASLKLEKLTATDKRYIERLLMVGSTMTLDGTPIVTSTMVAVDDFLVGNFPFATVWDKGEIRIEVGLDGNDFTKNMRTILAEWRGLALVKTNMRTAFIEGDFTTAEAALETA